MPEPMVRVIDLCKRFGGVLATDNVSLTIAPGEFRALIGPNGAGKSTLFNLITGFLAPDAGRVIFGGSDITGLPPHRLFHEGISRTFQITSIFPDLSIEENVHVALLSYHRKILDVFRPAVGRYRDEVQELLDLVGLAGEADRLADTLSHGDRKRLELAVALANKPQLLLLDEPTAGMAAAERLESIRAVHRTAKKLGVTVFFTEHDMEVVFSVADRISVLHQGAILAEDTPEIIRQNERVQEIYLGEDIASLADILGETVTT